MPRIRLVLLLLATLLLQACAAAPKVAPAAWSEQALTSIEDSDSSQVRRWRDRDALDELATVALPRIELASDAVDARITDPQAAVVLNRVGRDVCSGLAPYVIIGDAGTDAAPTANVRLRVRAIAPTSAGTAGLSEVVGFFVPGPFRIPAGLGGLAVDGEVRSGEAPLLLMQWAQGANPLLEGARVSAIGDAYQLAGEFADDFVDALLARDATDRPRRPRLDDDTVARNKALCRSAFGRANVAGAGASFLIGLPPEAIDAGAPDPAADPAAAAN